jgi:galactosylceramidase
MNYGKLAISMFFLLSVIQIPIKGQQQISIQLSDSGRVYEGIGACDGGASSRLLIDYPEPFRSQILDFLFKPNYGANLQNLKVEIGGDVNSTDGTEPSFARTRKEFENPKLTYFQRGYEWWLMKQAKKRNPAIKLGCLEWGCPGWIGNGKFYSQDNINYMIAFLKGAKKYHNLNFDYIGIWNERPYNIEFIKNLRRSLNYNGLKSVQIVGADQDGSKEWHIADDMIQDKKLRKAIGVIGAHYPERFTSYNSSGQSKSLGIPIWNSEGGLWRSTWKGFEYLAKMINRDYIEGRMTNNIIWSLITSYYNNLSLPNSGLMTANTPWSGYYKVDPTIWAVAHTTQFVKPGWRYINSSCGYLHAGGSFVTLASTSVKMPNISMVLETMDADKPQQVIIKINRNKKIKRLYVWRTIVNGNTFEEESSIFVKNNEFSLTLEPKSLYTLTTTTGQHKGVTAIPTYKSFPFPFKTDFDDEKLLTSPKYFSDQGGAFEVVKRNDGKGNCLRQMIIRNPIEWEECQSLNQTILGDTTWNNYSVHCDVYFNDPYSYATLLARISDMHRSHQQPDAYILKLQSSGQWLLMTNRKVLSSGLIPLDKHEWQHMTLTVKGHQIGGTINGDQVSSVMDTTYTHGLAGLGSSHDHVDFDNFEVK